MRRSEGVKVFLAKVTIILTKLIEGELKDDLSVSVRSGVDAEEQVKSDEERAGLRVSTTSLDKRIEGASKRR